MGIQDGLEYLSRYPWKLNAQNTVFTNVVFVVNYSRQNSYINSLLDKLKFFWLTPSKTDEITIVFASLCG